MKLYHHPMSSNARKAVMTALLLQEQGAAPVELVLVDLAKGEQKKPEFLAINPNGKVPALVDGDFALWESYAIMQYLADGTALFPTEKKARAIVTQWMFWGAAHWTAQISVLTAENLLKKMFGRGEPDPHVVQRAEGLLRDCAKVLDAHLATRTWVCGDALTIADVTLACPLMTTVPAKLPVTDFEHIQRWFARVQDLPAWKKTGMG